MKRLLAIVLAAALIMAGGSLSGFAAQEEPELVHQTLKSEKVRLEGMMPEGAEVTAKDASETKAVKKLDSGMGNAIAAYDITIRDGGGEYQPDAGDPIRVEIRNEKIKPNTPLAVWHIPDKGNPEKIKNFEIEDGKVTFEAAGFSVYAVVASPDPYDPETKEHVLSLEELAEDYGNPESGGQGFYISYGNKRYATSSVNGNGAFIETTQIGSAAKWFFESAGADNTYYIYTYLNNSSVKSYMQNTTGSEMGLTTNTAERAAFELELAETGKFFFKLTTDNKWLQHSNGGNGIRLWTDHNHATNPRLILTYVYHEVEVEDPYKDFLEGKKFGFLRYQGGNTGKAVMANEFGSGALEPQITIVMQDTHYNKLFVPANTDMSMWEFIWSGFEDYYYIKSDGKFLNMTASGVSLVDSQADATRIQFKPGEGLHEQEFCLRTDDATLTYSGSMDTGFSVNGETGTEWLYLTEISPGEHPGYHETYSATKISASEIQNGAHVIIYTRVWNDEEKHYNHYAIDGRGNLTRVTESGESIEWLGTETNTLLWDFIEHYWEGTDDPNDYYDFYNEASKKYLAPLLTGDRIVGDDPVGLNMMGRVKGYFETPIVAWDDTSYRFSGFKPNDELTKLVPCRIAETPDYYFAIVDEPDAEDETHDVATVDHEKYGITMKITDFDATSPKIAHNPMSAFLGNDTGTAGAPPTQGLLSTRLGDDGYPVAKGGSLKTLLTEKGCDAQRQVNHLFIENLYQATGYLEYDSTKNYAALQDDNDFIVHHEIGTYDSAGSKNTLKHGQFLPFNDIKPSSFAQINRYNHYDALAQPLPANDPRRDEDLYLAQGDANLYFGMELEAPFSQTPNGKDNWGNDIVYEFTGDDDFWLYVDGELIIDLGGIHSALPGRVNYATGDVYVNGVHKTLRQIFEENFRGRNPGATDAQVADFLDDYFDEGSTIFRPYSNHTMRIFYFERGAGASNLHMRFNLASVRPGTVELSKELTGADDLEEVLAEYPYQIFYTDEDGVEHQFDRPRHYVTYKDTVNSVPYEAELTLEGPSGTPVTYDHVYLLRPGDTAVIEFPEGTKSYRIVECYIDTTVYESVSVNGQELPGEPTAFAHRRDYGIPNASTQDRPRVMYTNEIHHEALRIMTIKKQLYDFDGVHQIHHDEDATRFNFRLSMNTEYDEEMTLANLFPYRVKDENDEYCYWDPTDEKFKSIGKSRYEDLTPLEWLAVTFHTSIRGAISKIPNEFTVEIRGLLAGTKFNVTERSGETPDGYLFKQYVYDGEERPEEADEGVTSTIETDEDPDLVVENKKVWAFRVNKVWSDGDYMEDRDPAYFALYTLSIVEGREVVELVDGSVRQMPFDGEQTLYWYYEDVLPVAKPLSQYVIREVTVVNPVVDPVTGVVTADSVTSIPQGESVTYTGTPEEGTPGQYHYNVNYNYQDIGKDHVRQVKTTNERHDMPLVLKKTDMEGNPVSDCVFVRENETTGRRFTHTSDEAGIITRAYLQDNVWYTLTETKPKKGYQGVEHPFRIKVDEHDVVTVQTENGEEMYDLKQEEGRDPAVLTIRNRPYTITLLKEDKDSGEGLPDAVFAMDQEVHAGGATSFNPMPEYADLRTDADGKAAIDTTGLAAGTYRIRETTAPVGYQKIPIDIAPQYMISDKGVVTLKTPEDPAYLSSEIAQTPDGTVKYTITVMNEKPEIAPTGYDGNFWPFLLLLLIGLGIWKTADYRKKHREE